MNYRRRDGTLMPRVTLTCLRCGALVTGPQRSNRRELCNCETPMAAEEES